MRSLHKKDRERVSLSIAIAVSLHIALFLILEYGEFIKVEPPAEYVGPMEVEISQVTNIPEPAEEPSETTAEEEPFVEEPEAPEEEPQVAPETETQAETTEPRDSEAVTEQPSPEPAVPEEPEAEQTQPEAEAEPEYTVPTPPEAQPETPENEYNGTDQGNEFHIQMSSIAKTAKPNIGPSIAANLPEVAETLEEQVTVTFSFILGPDGTITYLHLDESSGYREIDRAVERTLRQWKFSRPIKQDRVTGEFTYVLKP
jgi:protein TonB